MSRKWGFFVSDIRESAPYKPSSTANCSLSLVPFSDFLSAASIHFQSLLISGKPAWWSIA
jgi:hypothetical protein